MGGARYDHTATLLPDGTVLVAGGSSGGGYGREATAERYDPASGSWAATGSMGGDRVGHTATLLTDGTVLVPELGLTVVDPLSGFEERPAERYDPASGSWSPTANMIVARDDHTATLLSNGWVLVTGGYNYPLGVLATAELYNPGG
jgi:hypothetical protein